MRKVSPKLCGMPWNVKKTIVDSLELVPRIRLGQCCTEFQQLVDCTKVKYDFVSLNFRLTNCQEEMVEIRVEKNHKIESTLILIDWNEGRHEIGSKTTEDSIESGDGNFIAGAVTHLLKNINKPNVSIGTLEVNFMKQQPEQTLENWHDMNGKVINRMMNVLCVIRSFNAGLNKIKAEHLALSQIGGCPRFVETFLTFFDKKILRDVKCHLYATSKYTENKLLEEAKTQLIIAKALELESLSVEVEYLSKIYMMNVTEFMTESAHCKKFIINYTVPNDSMSYYFSHFPVDPMNQNCRVLPHKNSKHCVLAEVSPDKITFLLGSM